MFKPGPRPFPRMSCPHCGAATNPGASFCSACGASLAAPAPAAPATPAAPYAPPTHPAPAQRPVGVTIIGILMIVFAAFSLLGILAAAIFVGVFQAAMFSAPWGEEWAIPGALIGAIATILMLFALGLAALSLIAGIGLLQGKGWAWVLTLVVMGLQAASSLLGLATRDFESVLGLIVPGIVIWYFLRPEVKAWFGRP